MADMTIKEIEDLATWAESITTDAPDDMGFPVAALDLKRFASALRQLLNAQKWREIETAPKDGTWVLAFYPKEKTFPTAESIKPARWVESFFDGEDGFLDCAEHEEFDQPTHWLPLPSPPQEEPSDV